MSRVDKIDTLLGTYQQKHPNQITAELINDLLSDKPVTRTDHGKDFIEFVQERLKSDHSRNRIGQSRYENGMSGMNVFQEFLISTHRGTYQPNSIFVGDLTVDLIEAYIDWRRTVKHNTMGPLIMLLLQSRRQLHTPPNSK
jgi:hypothetical protein